MSSESDSPANSAAPQITQLLRSAAAGNNAALGEVYATLYPELKRMAHAALYRQGRADALQTTVLVHESFLRLVANHGFKIEDRRHFFAYAARTMRNLIIDNAREQLAQWRGGDVEHVTYTAEYAAQMVQAGDELMRVDQALRELEAMDPELCELVEMRYFGGYTETEVAELLGISDRTVRRRWDKARAWLYVALSEGQDG